MTKFGFVFLVLLAATALWAVSRPRPRGRIPADPVVARNERLTALTGLALYLLLVAVVVTIAGISGLLGAHYLVGFLLIPPVLLKLGSTGYRFWRYYAGGGPFRLAGAPPVLLRFVVAPVLVASTVVVLATGVELWLFGLRFGSIWMPIHTVSAVVMLFAVTAHLLAHLRRSGDAFTEELAGTTRVPPAVRTWVIASLVSGAALALASLLYATPFPTSAAGS